MIVPIALKIKWVKAVLLAATLAPIAANKAVTVVPMLSPKRDGNCLLISYCSLVS